MHNPIKKWQAELNYFVHAHYIINEFKDAVVIREVREIDKYELVKDWMRHCKEDFLERLADYDVSEYFEMITALQSSNFVEYHKIILNLFWSRVELLLQDYIAENINVLEDEQREESQC